jgi:cobalt-zinc-cadmium efflux system membrane fusion protein
MRTSTLAVEARRSLAPVVVAQLLLLASVGCGRQSPAPRPAAEAAEVEASTHPEEENAIHLSEDMVRDLRISTAGVAERTGAQTVSVLGQIAADQARYAEVAPPTAGQVVRMLVEQNVHVREGAALAELRSPELGRARADLITAEARRDLAQQAVERKRSLAADRIVAVREVQEAEAAFRAATAEARAAATNLRALGFSPDETDVDPSVFLLRTPLAGQVIERRAVLGQHADTDSPLFIVADLSRLWLIAQVFERDAVNLRVGTVAHITMAALPGGEIDGRVTQVGRQVDAGSRTVPVRIELANPTGALRPGMSATARLEVVGTTQQVLAVPAAAVQRVGQEWLAFVPRSSQEFEMRPVGRGRDLGNEVEIVSGLKAGETVVVDGAFLLKAEAEKRRGGGDEHEH